MKRELITPAIETPISLIEAKANLNIEHSADDSVITRCIAAATDYAEKYTGRHLMPQAWRYYFDCFDNPLMLPSVPAESVANLNYFDENNVQQVLIENTDFYAVLVGVNPAVVPIGGVWPTSHNRPNAISIEVTSGYSGASAVPEGIKQAIHLLVGHWYENREAVIIGTISSALPLGVSETLNQYRVIGI